MQSDMRARFQLGESKPVGRIGLLMSVVSKSNPNAKRKTFPSVSKQEDNPFLNGSTPADALESSAGMGVNIRFLADKTLHFSSLH